MLVAQTGWGDGIVREYELCLGTARSLLRDSFGLFLNNLVAPSRISHAYIASEEVSIQRVGSPHGFSAPLDNA